MNHRDIADNLQKLLSRAEAANGKQGTELTEKRKKASDFIRGMAKATGMKVGADRDSLERLGGFLRWHKSGAAAAAKAKGKKAKTKK